MPDTIELLSLVNRALEEVFNEEKIKEDNYYWVIITKKLNELKELNLKQEEVALYLASSFILIKYGNYDNASSIRRAAFRVGNLSYEGPENVNEENINKAKVIIKQLVGESKLMGVVNV